MILLTPEVLVYLVLEMVLLLLVGVAWAVSLPILGKWDFDATSSQQYQLEKRAFLVTLIILFVLFTKLVLFPYLAFTLDKLALVVPGAMCAAGVINANGFGFWLLATKLAVLLLAGIWLLIHRLDIQATNYPYLKAKLFFFLFMGGVVVAESTLDIMFLTNISTLTPVQCCSVVFGVASTGGGLPLGWTIPTLLSLFYLTYGLIMVLSLARYRLLNFLANLAFLFFGYFALVTFFGTYVYQLPTHQCPFCMLQQEYFFIGYLLWGSLFLGVFMGMADGLLNTVTGREVPHIRSWCMVSHSVFVITCTLYVGLYFLRNGVWL